MLHFLEVREHQHNLNAFTQQTLSNWSKQNGQQQQHQNTLLLGSNKLVVMSSHNRQKVADSNPDWVQFTMTKQS